MLSQQSFCDIQFEEIFTFNQMFYLIMHKYIFILDAIAIKISAYVTFTLSF